jgi:DNA-binding MarR family transcriptional regulator
VATPRTEADLALSLYVALGQIIRGLRQEAPESDVGPGGFGVLVSIDQQGPSRLGTLADAVAVTAPSMTRIVNTLEAEGLVVREPDPNDGRAQLVAMTPAGRALLSSGREVRLAALRRRLDDLPPEERARIEAAMPALGLLGGAAVLTP